MKGLSSLALDRFLSTLAVVVVGANRSFQSACGLALGGTIASGAASAADRGARVGRLSLMPLAVAADGKLGAGPCLGHFGAVLHPAQLEASNKK